MQISKTLNYNEVLFFFLGLYFEGGGFNDIVFGFIIVLRN
jgi:hypothetical protein